MAMNMDAMLRIKADVQGENNIRRLGNSMQGLQGQVKNAALGFNNLKGAVGAFGAAIAGSAIVGGLTSVVKRSIDAGDELFNLQAKTGITAEALIGLGNAAKLADVDQATLGKGLTKLSVNLVKAAEGNDALARKFQALGVSVKDANGQVVPADQALKQIADRFADMPDGAQKAAAAVALFGKSGADLIPLLNEGAAAMEKFTYKVGEDFAARSDLFNDTITELGIKTQGFGLELTDALLPALQSILEVFGDLFDTKNDWTALFDVIKVAVRGVATVIYATIKLVDVAIKNVVAYFEAVGKVLQGDFEGAADVIRNRIGNLLEQARRDFAQIQKLWTDAPSPGTGRRTSGRSMALDTTDADREAADRARKAAAEAKRAASEQERLQERRATLTQKAIDLQEQLRQSIEDATAAYVGVGASPLDQLFLQRNESLTENNRQITELTRNVVELWREVQAAGGQMDIQPFRELIDRLSAANSVLAEKDYQQGLKDLLPPLEDYNAKIAEAILLEENRKAGIEGLSAVQQLQLQIQQLGLDVLAKTNEELAKYLKQLLDAAKKLDDVSKAAKETFGESFRKTFQDAYKQATDLGGQLGGTLVSGIDGLTNAIVDFAATGKAAFKEFAASVLQELGKILVKYALFSAIKGIFPGLGIGMAATGGATGPMSSAPLRRYAEGGIARAPQVSIYGERGPEAFVPLPDGRSIPVKMKQRSDALNRYKPISATGTAAMPGDPANPAAAGAAAGGPIDVRYTVERINNVEYVTADQFQQGMRQAAAQGAQRGEQRALRSLQQSTAVRNRVGIR